jgi:Firmicute plasmid replication protein (RepL)
MSKVTSLIRTINTDGEILEELSTRKIQNEPDYIKLYIEHITVLGELPKWVTPILMELLKYVNYENKIILNSSIKKMIATNLEIAYKTIDNTLVKLTKAEILIREDKGIYIANPHLFGRGKWENIRRIRATINYSPESKGVIQSFIEKD